MRLFYWIIYIIVYVPLRLLFPFKVIGKENLPPKKSLLIVSNHLSWFDVVLIPLTIPGFRFTVSKKENGKNPVARFFLKLFGAVFIDRDNIDVSSMRNLVKILKRGKNITLFPEGTRNRTGTELQPIKNGVSLIALQSSATVLPVMIANRPKIFKKNYVYIAPPFNLNEKVERPYNGERISEATEIISENMKEALTYVHSVAEAKKRKKRAENKI